MRHALFAGVVTVTFLSAMVYAAPPRGRPADRNNDGRVDARERVNARADADKDGKVEPAEARKAREEAKKAAVVDRPWEAKADLNKDGKVDLVELRKFHRVALDANNNGVIDAAERTAFWVLRKSKVNTPAEAKYDTNGDGFLTGDEARQFLRDRAILIATKGKAKVSNPLEAEFDADNDGIIDPSEAEIMKDATGEL